MLEVSNLYDLVAGVLGNTRLQGMRGLCGVRLAAVGHIACEMEGEKVWKAEASVYRYMSFLQKGEVDPSMQKLGLQRMARNLGVHDSSIQVEVRQQEEEHRGYMEVAPLLLAKVDSCSHSSCHRDSESAR